MLVLEFRVKAKVRVRVRARVKTLKDSWGTKHLQGTKRLGHEMSESRYRN